MAATTTRGRWEERIKFFSYLKETNADEESE